MMGSKEAAQHLGISQTRVRQLIEAGELAADRVGGRWIVSGDSLHRLTGRSRPCGRPFSERVAWGVLFELSGIATPWLSAPERSRIRRRVAERTWLELAPRLRSRSVVHQMEGHRSVPSRLEHDRRLVRGGASSGLAGIIHGDRFEGYVRADELGELVDRYALEPADSEGNVILRVVSSGEWRLEPAQRVAPVPVVAFDLIEAGDDRSIEAGLLMLER